MNTIFIKGKPAVTNDLRKLKNPFWPVIFLRKLFSKILFFSKDLIHFTISFVSLFVRVIDEPVIEEIPFLIFLTSKLSPMSTRI